MTQAAGEGRNRFARLGLLAFTAVLLAAGCAKPPATRTEPPPRPVFVRLATLEAAHPLAGSLRDLDAAAMRLRTDTALPPAEAFAPVVLKAMPAQNTLSEARRNTVARAALRRSAEATLRAYVAARERTEQRIRDEKRAELQGIARASSAGEEAVARTRIEAQTRDALFARAEKERTATIRRDAASVNLSNDNVISVARDPETRLPDAAVLERQVVELKKRNPPLRVLPSLSSDEARLTKLLRDWQDEIARIRAANDRDVAFNDGLIADAIATIRAENDIRVEKQLAQLFNNRESTAELSAIRAQLLALLQNLRQSEQFATGGVQAPVSVVPMAVAPPGSTSATTGVLRRLLAERTAIRTAIRRDVTAAVRDAGFAHRLAPSLAASPALSDRTGDFQHWIFGNVRATSLSK